MAFALRSVIFIFLSFKNNGSVKGQVIDRTIDKRDFQRSLDNVQ
jgi:hypothetical protein